MARALMTVPSVALSRVQARQIAVRAQVLDGTGRDILDVVRRLGFLQLDPTSRVAPSHLLVLWSRLGSFDREDLDRLLWQDRALFEYKAFIYAAEDFPITKAAMRRFPGDAGAWRRRVGAWIRANAPFEPYLLLQLRDRGPILARDLEDRSERPWTSTGWTHGRNVTQMLHFLGAQGKVMVAGRQGRQRLWDLPERVLPRSLLRARPAADRLVAERKLRSLGLVRPSRAYAGIGEPVRIRGVAGDWVVDPWALEHVDERLPLRTTLLAPFDQLIYDRERAEDLFGFRYRIAIYTAAARRTDGFYDLPILQGSRLVGRVDSAYDRRKCVLHVNAIRPEPRSRLRRPAIRNALRSLGEFLGARRVTSAVGWAR